MATQRELIEQRLSGGAVQSEQRSLIEERLTGTNASLVNLEQHDVDFDKLSRNVFLPVLRLSEQAQANRVDRSVFGEAGVSLIRGTLELQTTLPGNLLTMAGDITGIDAVRDAGTFLRMAGAIARIEFPPSGQTDDGVRKFVGAVFESSPAFGLQVGGAMLAGPIAFVGLGVGPVVGDQYVETKERRLREGATEEEAIRDAYIEAGIAGMITGVTSLLPAKVIPPNMAKPVEKVLSKVAFAMLEGGVAEGVQEGLEKVLTDLSLAIKRKDFEALKRMLTIKYLKEVGFEAGVGGVLGTAGKGVSIASEPDAIAQDQAQIIKTAAPQDPVEPVAAPRDAPTVLAPTEAPVVQPAVTKALDGLDAAERTVAEEAALDVLADETSSDEDQQKAAQVIESLDQSTSPAGEAGTGLIPVTFVGFQEGTKNVPGFNMINLPNGSTVKFDPAKHTITGVDPAAEPGAEIPAALQATKPTASQKKAFLKGIGVDTSKKVQRTVTEKAALNASLRAQKRVAEIVSKRVRADVKAAASSKGKIEKATRVFVRRLIRSTVARGNQGRLLQLVENANPRTLETILDRVDLEIATDKLSERSSETTSLNKKIKKAKFISEDERGEFLKELDRLEGLAAGAKAFKQVESIDKAAEQINDGLSDVAQEFAAAQASRKKLAAGKYKNVKDTVKQIIARINAPEAGPLSTDEPTSTFDKAKILISDIRRLTRKVENNNESVLEKLMWREMTRAHDEHELHMGVREGQLEAAAKSFGFSNLADAFVQLSDQGGEALTRRVDVVVEGKDVSMTMGQAMWFVAIDAETEAKLLSGEKVVLSEGRKQKGATISEAELDGIRAKVPIELRQFVRAAKAVAGQDTTVLFETFLDLNGREPRRVSGYFRRKRARQSSEAAGKPKAWKDILVQYMENLGIGKERSGSLKDPIVVEDFLTAIFEQISDTSKVIHVAKPIREASSVLFTPEVQTAINVKYGDDMNDAFVTHLAAASLANASVTKLGKAARFFNGSLAVAKLGLNPSSWLKQIGGMFRLLPLLGFERMKTGLSNINSVTMKQMTDHSGFFLTRYVRNIVGRFSPIDVEAGQPFGSDRATLMATLDRASRNFYAGDIAATGLALRDAALSSLEILNFFDGLNARVAWAAYKQEVQEKHPEWTEARQLLWVGEKASDAVRETQNSSSVLDMTTASLLARGNGLSLWLLFSSDRMKTPNRIVRGIQEGRGAETVAAEMMNVVWSIGVGRGVTLTTALMVAFALGDEDDIDEAFKRAVRLDRNLWALAMETVTLIDPVIAPALIETLAFGRAQVFDTAVGSSITDLIVSGNDLAKSAIALSQGDYETFRKKLIKGGVGAVLETGALLGVNPLDVQMRRMLSAYDKLDEDEQNKLSRGDIP